MRVKAVLIAFAIILIAGCQQQEDNYNGDIKKITLAAYEGDTGLLPYIAEKQGYFASNGLDVTINNYEAGKLAADALLAGEADISTSADAVLVSNSFAYPELRVLGTVAVVQPNGLIARKDRGIKVGADLLGKKIGVTKKSAAEFNLGVFLIFNRLSIEDVEIVDLKPSETVDAIISGEIDAGFTWEPNIYNGQIQLGENAVVIKENVPHINFILLSKESWLVKNPDAAKRFIKAIVQAERYVKENEEEARQFMKERFNYKEEYSILTWQDHNFIVGLPQSLILKFEDVARWRIKNGLTAANKVPNYLDNIYLDALDEIKPEAITIIR
jgi:NitT/TauT family transport system substrate-binding protein